MGSGPSRRWIVAPRARQRTDAALRWLDGLPPDGGALIASATVEAANAIARRALSRPGVGARLGWHRLGLGALAGRLAALALAAEGRVPATPLAIDAVCARLLHEASDGGATHLGRFAPVAREPGLPRALARTLRDLRLGHVDRARLAERDPDLADLLRAFEARLAREGLADRAATFDVATDVVLGRAAIPSEEASALVGLPLLLLDCPVEHPAEAALVVALVERAPTALATLPAGEVRAVALLERAFGALPRPGARADGDRPPSVRPSQLDLFDAAAADDDADAPPAAPTGDLARLQRRLFVDRADDDGASAADDGSVAIFSAPGEGRECVEIARRIRAEAEAGTPFDRVAVLLRSPELYRTPLADALGRAGIPFVPSRGTVRPSPSGRALLALLACRAEGYSARAFAEYLSLGALPTPAPDGGPPAAGDAPGRWVPADEAMLPAPPPEPGDPGPEDGAGEEVAGERPPVPSPRRWERILVDAAVVGGAARWRRRLGGLAHALEIERDERLRADPEDPRAAAIGRDLDDLAALQAFALPLLDDLADLPDEAPWGRWLDALSALAHRALREPEVVQRVLAELAPMAPVGPVGLGEVRLVLEDRLTHLVDPPPDRAGGAVRVASVEEARGLSWDVVFIPGLAERVFPKRLAEDPLLLDAARREVDPRLVEGEDRVMAERLALRLAVGAAERRVALSWPRVEVERARPRVPSFYALEVLRAATGTLPGYEALRRRAEETGAARMAWPAPDTAERAIDAAEFDLAVLRDLLETPDPAAQRGAARYLLEASPHLARALRFRARRWGVGRFLPPDGLVDPPPAALEALAAHRLDRRPWSPTALEAFAACPYRFYLKAVLRLAPREVPEPVDQLDALQRGRLVHEAQRITLESLRDAGGLDLRDEAAVDAALRRLDEVVTEVAGRYREELVPAIERVWEDGVDEVRGDLREWLRHVAGDPWRPRWFELAFGLPGREGHDPDSVDAPIALDEGLTIRGSIDVVEERGPRLRATDAKTGRATDPITGRARIPEEAVIRGGRSLQPALYAMALDKRFPDREVDGGRLFFCTSRGGFHSHFVPLDGETRAAVRVLADAVGDALERGFLPAAPDEGACRWCDYQPVCGPHEELRLRSIKLRGSGAHALEKLHALRRQR